MSRRRPATLRRHSVALGIAALLTATVAAPATALTAGPTRPAHTAGTRLDDVHVLVHFDRAAGQVAESIAPEPDGSVVIGMIPARQVVHVARNGAVQTLVTMPLPPGGGGTTPVVGSPVVTGVCPLGQ
ncbi:hypothetical protein [Streptomyces sp. NPDC058294]|uniref:hypothetical protein n=1 Tax=Streptomyces sp. NPDC058294 TaxID=3346430 RepID=UPI0036EF981F